MTYSLVAFISPCQNNADVWVFGSRLIRRNKSYFGWKPGWGRASAWNCRCHVATLVAVLDVLNWQSRCAVILRGVTFW